MLSAFVALIALGAPAAPAAAGRAQQPAGDADTGGIGLRLLDIPTDRVADPRAQVYVVDHVRPGSTISRRVEVRNTSTQPLRVELYAGAASIVGTAFTVPEGRKGNELSGWVRLGRKTVDLEPDGRKAVTVDIVVPKSASKGERYGAIWAQVTSPSGRGGNVTQVHRVGVRLYLDVGPGGEPPTDFRIESVTARPGAGRFPVVTAHVVNTGERALDMTGTLTLSKDAVRAGPFRVSSGATIPPGGSGDVGIELDQSLPAGLWDVRLVLASGTVERTAEGRITLPVPGTVAMTAGRPAWLVYSVGTATALALLVAAGVWYLFRRRTRVRVAPSG
ncbi:MULTISPECIES: DUF916 domain-containing protein [unclassified Micromonospora]|uniref:DUF916 domain-containing protein n=1 Tax=unclassified Micromonospora TaxID=2617518 RepID=UPI001C21BFEA|nr:MULTISPECIES: DUF916 domain-containing protein [unclassified Micromonospora]MBU8855846.1 DUF916 domain-containing protein [Micromonospora sp. WMMB482]MDM4781448.1 DUF916 domain-containing protein [Micromonospora sp. b486]